MLKALVGMASKHGISVFQPERDDTLLFVRRCVRTGVRRFGFWAYLQETEAQSIQKLFDHGRRKEAMAALERSAQVIGRFCPATQVTSPLINLPARFVPV